MGENKKCSKPPSSLYMPLSFVSVFRCFQSSRTQPTVAGGCQKTAPPEISRDIQRIGWVAYLLNGHATGTDWLEVPTIYKAYFSGLWAYVREYPYKIWPYMVLTYLHFRILKFPLIFWQSNCISIAPYQWLDSPRQPELCLLEPIKYSYNHLVNPNLDQVMCVNLT